MKLSKKFRNFSAIFSFIVLLIFSLAKVWQSVTELQILGETDESGREYALVTRIIDGDTVELSDGRKVRYIGVDTPETKDPRKEVECYGQEAALRNRELVEGQIVALETDVQDKDQYGRLLRYVYQSDKMINAVLVAEGYAFASAYPPNVKYQEKFIQHQQQAREEKLGLWAECQLNDVEQINQMIKSVDEDLIESVKQEIDQALEVEFSF